MASPFTELYMTKNKIYERQPKQVLLLEYTDAHISSRFASRQLTAKDIEKLRTDLYNVDSHDYTNVRIEFAWEAKIKIWGTTLESDLDYNIRIARYEKARENAIASKTKSKMTRLKRVEAEIKKLQERALRIQNE